MTDSNVMVSSSSTTDNFAAPTISHSVADCPHTYKWEYKLEVDGISAVWDDVNNWSGLSAEDGSSLTVDTLTEM